MDSAAFHQAPCHMDHKIKTVAFYLFIFKPVAQGVEKGAKSSDKLAHVATFMSFFFF